MLGSSGTIAAYKDTLYHVPDPIYVTTSCYIKLEYALLYIGSLEDFQFFVMFLFFSHILQSVTGAVIFHDMQSVSKVSLVQNVSLSHSTSYGARKLHTQCFNWL